MVVKAYLICPKIWNSIPTELKQESSLKILKSLSNYGNLYIVRAGCVNIT